MKKGVRKQSGACANQTQDDPEGADSMDEIIEDGTVRWPQKEVLLVPEGQDEQENRFSTVRREAAAQYQDTLREFFAEKGSHWTHPVGSPHIFCPEMEAEQYEMSGADESTSRYSDDLDKTDQSCSAKCDRPCLVHRKNYSEDNDSRTDGKE